MHINGKSRVKWNKEVSEYFNVSNSVRQGSVPSLYICLAYIDKLIENQIAGLVNSLWFACLCR